jgi:hypothetical protein
MVHVNISSSTGQKIRRVIELSIRLILERLTWPIRRDRRSVSLTGYTSVLLVADESLD